MFSPEFAPVCWGKASHLTMPRASVRGYAAVQQRSQFLTATRASNRYCRMTFLITSAMPSRNCNVSILKAAKQRAFRFAIFPAFLGS